MNRHNLAPEILKQQIDRMEDAYIGDIDNLSYLEDLRRVFVEDASNTKYFIKIMTFMGI